MAEPMTVDLPHSLGAEEARRRIERGMGDIGRQIPGGARVDTRWEGDRLALEVGAMGQQVSARIHPMERVVRVELSLPPALGFFRGLIEAGVQEAGTRLLEDRSKREG